MYPSKEVSIEKMPLKSGLTWTLALTVFLACFGSPFLLGYNLGVMNLPANHVKEFLSVNYLTGNATTRGSSSNEAQATILYALTSTVFVICGAIGAFSSGWVADLVGRRNGLLMNHAFAILGGIVAWPCVKVSMPWLIYAGRALHGINGGITIGLTAIYLAELAPRELRGAIGACNQLALTIGIAWSYVLTLSVTFGTKWLWPAAVGFNIFPSLISLVTLPFCPESPRFLFVSKKDEPAARAAFLRLNCRDNVETFIGELREELEAAQNQPKFKFSQLFTQRDLRMPVLIACLIQVIQQLSGINAVISYSSIMLEGAGVDKKYMDYCVLAIGVLNVVVTVVSLPLLERAGRRTLILWPTVAVAASLLVLTITVNLSSKLEGQAGRALGIISIVFILIYIVGFALGLGPVPALIVAEIFRQGPRAAAYSLSQSLQWTANLLVLVSYPSMQAAIGGYAFLPFLVVVAVLWVFFFLFMPETKNRTFDEVARDLAFGNIVVGKRTARLEEQDMAVFTKDSERNASNPEGATTQPLLNQNVTA